MNSVLGKNDDITFFEYMKKNNRENGTAIIGIELKFSKDLDDLMKKMKDINFHSHIKLILKLDNESIYFSGTGSSISRDG